jgi:hypothetical protein
MKTESKTTKGLCLHTLQHVRFEVLNFIEALGANLPAHEAARLYSVASMIHAEIMKEEQALDEWFKEMNEERE